MRYKPFHFKRFSVAQNHCTHKVGTDGVLLGAWVNIRDQDRSILDVGTGSGVIALMLAQRSSPATLIDAVDLEPLDARQASENVSASPWPKKIRVHQQAVQEYLPGRQYDLIISNPPWFMNSQRPPDQRRRQARHTDGLSFEDLLHSATRLLKKEGRFSLILPYTEGLHFLKLAKEFDLSPIRKATFRARASKPAERILLELAYAGECDAEAEIILYEEGDSWSESYHTLTHEFYLEA